MVDVNRTTESFREASGSGRSRATGIYVAIVKGNSDPQRMGRLSVYVPEFGGQPDNPASWYVVSYASPFAGASNIENNAKDGEAAKKQAGTQTSYGWWAVPPDLNNEVLVCFANGDTTRGYWFACLYQQFMNHMVPGLALNLSTNDEVNKLNLPPVCEYNKKDQENASKYWDPKRPIFESLYEGLRQQGLFTDPERGPSTTSARRESPSKVFGLSTPNGNTMHIDDNPDNELIRFRTKSGVQILIHETTGYIYMNSKMGNSWFEVSDEGINFYSKGTINFRAEAGINMHTDAQMRTHANQHHTRTESHHTTAAQGDHTTEAQGNTTVTADGTHTHNAREHARNSDRITDAQGPSRTTISNSTTQSNSTSQANSTSQSGSASQNGQNGQSQNGQNQQANTSLGPIRPGDHRNDRNGLSDGATNMLGQVENKFGRQLVSSGNGGVHTQNSDHNWNVPGQPSDAVDLSVRGMSRQQQTAIVNYANSLPGGWAQLEGRGDSGGLSSGAHIHISYRGPDSYRGARR